MDFYLTVPYPPTRGMARAFYQRSEAAHGVDVLFSIILLEDAEKNAVRVRGALEGPRDCFCYFGISVTCNRYEYGLVRPEIFPFRDLRRAFPVQKGLRQDLCGNQISGVI